ncbi:TetR/AcrR family transcriptional regulator [Paracoccus sp. (in: a-proteobacteria)]|uniref:TetR/AcrR family transcriptional regulator n=1 Tax=Paracoccus sp. TaxID=267 RepID=UPI0026DFC379|nr:TetR/AcrR family transcriptional regulator [Paracoccus sp. (in: a-proteobacteria)]MDO5646500.1 TetR/AcrR family transcriptional regulator [Paracoccus sp. (in: a-proteobacteria)]
MQTINPRRYRISKTIQAAAIELAMRDGLSNVTTESIARHAGISTRTFFNYYPYKEAALMGPGLAYPADAAAEFVAGAGPLMDDVQHLIRAHLRRFLDERTMLGNLLKLSETDPKLSALMNSGTIALRTQMRNLLALRLPGQPAPVIEILAAAIVAATTDATRSWTRGETNDFIAEAEANLAMILPAAELLARD